MGSFSYKARTGQGELVIGDIVADSPTGAARELKKLGYFPISLNESTVETAEAKTAQAAAREGWVRRDAVADFFRQLTDLLESGAPLLRALELLGENSKNKKMATVIEELRGAVESGSSLSEAMKRRPAVFSRMVTGLVHAGETGGALISILKEIVNYMDEESALASKIRGMMAYPMITGLTGLASVTFFITYIIPKFADVFVDMGQALPAATRLLVAAGNAVTGAGWQTAVAIVAAAAILRGYAATPEGKKAADRALLSLPLIGGIVSQLGVGRFMSSLGLMLGNGVQMLEALELSIGAVDNSELRSKLERLPDAANEGMALSAALKASGAMDPVTVDMIRISEETGRLPEALVHLGKRNENKAYDSARMAVTYLEPSIIISVGIIVAIMVLGMMLPILQINLAV